MRHCKQMVFVLVCFICFGKTRSDQCLTPDNRQGNCMDLRQCASLYDLVRDFKVSNVEFLRKSHCAFYDYPWVCCPIDGGQKQQQQQTSSIQVPLVTSVVERGQQSGLSASDLPAPGVCGTSLDDRITNGEETAITEFPWMVLLEYAKPKGQKGFQCGGVLINKDYVLTACHCVKSRELTLLKWTVSGVRLGEWDLGTDEDCDEENCSDPVVDIPVIERIPHEDFNGNTRQNDIALLRLERSITFTNWIKPICLPISPEIANKIYDGKMLTVAGWGLTENGTTSDVKLKVEIDGVPLDDCNNTYRRRRIVLTNRQLCAGGGSLGKDSCKGDSGGPVMDKIKPDAEHIHFYLVGLVSFGPSPCGIEGWPSVTTRVSEYTDWILSHMRA